MYDIPNIDSIFVSQWHPKYDECEIDEPEYKSLVAQIRKELNHKDSLSKETFVRVLDWKSPRVKGIARLNEFPIYEKGIADAVRAEKDQKLGVLCRLRGVGAPVGSTFLHLMYPNEYPIIDIRTVETLHYAGLLSSPRTDITRYPAFTAEILKIARENQAFSLREIDRALFAYHKMLLSPKVKGNTIRTKVPKARSQASEGDPIDSHRNGTKARSLTGFSGTTTKFHDGLRQAMAIHSGETLRTSQLKKIVEGVPKLVENSQWIFPSDHCVNHTNKGACNCALGDDAIFEKIAFGIYRVRPLKA